MIFIDPDSCMHVVVQFHCSWNLMPSVIFVDIHETVCLVICLVYNCSAAAAVHVLTCTFILLKLH